ncbi:MAG: hypothetical protein JXB45_07225, partial [Candidatus Krumholzibacteriota bacterium]|nr:hypothetical protein [Candidatus Krumholzibacteriota bacterium]
VAAALGTPLVALFSGHTPDECGPFCPAERFVTLRAEDTGRAHKGLAAIDVDRVYQACLRQIEGRREKGG